MSGANKKSSSTTNQSTWHIPPPVLAGVAFATQVALSRRRLSSKRSRRTGAILGAGSMLLIGGAALQFRSNDTTINPKTLATTRLVTTGPNSLTRNPMYLGTAGLLASYAVVRRSGSALIPAILYTAVIDRVQIPAEEAALQARFGAAFERYRADTPRWIGWPASARCNNPRVRALWKIQ